MTTDTISYILNEKLGEPTNRWTSLFNSVSRMNLLSNAILSTDPRNRLYYFDTTSGMLYIQYLDGFTNEVNQNDPSSYVTQIINGNTYLANISKNYIEAENIGRYHQAVSMSQIVSFTYIDRDKERDLWLD